MRIAYVTAGNVGAGHLVRGLAIERGLARASFAGEYAIFGPASPYAAAHAPSHRSVAIPALDLADARRAPGTAFAAALIAYAPDLVVADIFWAPLRHVLPLLACEAWLLVRKCPSFWFQGPNDGCRFDASQFERILAIEPGLDGIPAHEAIDPIVIANPSDCRPPNALRDHFGVPAGTHLHVVMHAGVPGERAELQSSTGERVLDLFDDTALFPAAEWLGGADSVACGAGYNAFWESRWLGWFDRTTFTPFRRSIDDQAWRIATGSSHVMRENGADALARAIVRG